MFNCENNYTFSSFQKKQLSIIYFFLILSLYVLFVFKSILYKLSRENFDPKFNEIREGNVKEKVVNVSYRYKKTIKQLSKRYVG